MDRISRLGVILLLLGLSPPGHAEIEPWYALWSLGLTNHSYEVPPDQALGLARPFGDSDLQINLDMLGFYWPLGNHTAAGVIINGSSDTHIEDTAASNTGMDQVLQYLYALSLMHFFGPEIGVGPYLRLDAGAARLAFVSGNSLQADVDRSGSGYLVGAGWGLDLQGKARLLYGASYRVNDFDGLRYSNFAVSVGLMW